MQSYNKGSWGRGSTESCSFRFGNGNGLVRCVSFVKTNYYLLKQIFVTPSSRRLKVFQFTGCGRWIRTIDLVVMSRASYLLLHPAICYQELSERF